jgi:glutamyl/glutaminyl-tRNA synthetase
LGCHRIRFRPTANGYLHLGGAYVARLCYQVARQKAGELVLIVDDVAHAQKVGPLDRKQRAQVEAYRDAFEEDLLWLGCEPAHTVLASSLRNRHEAAAEALGIPEPGFGEFQGLLYYVHNTSETGPTCSYHPWLVLGRVTDDVALDVTGFIRGADLIAEAQLYDSLLHRVYGDGKRILQDYAPILLSPVSLGKCSKSVGGDTIREYRHAGVKPADMLAALGSAVPIGPTINGEPYGASWCRYARLSPKWEKLFCSL